MSALTNVIRHIKLNTNHLFSPNFLNLPALPAHLPTILASAIFYQLVFTQLAPLLYSLLKTENAESPTTKLARYYWHINVVSIIQSFINTIAAIYLLAHVGFRADLTAQERILGYHKETANVLAISTGYFCFHLLEAWAHGPFMVLHGICALFAVSLGFVSPLTIASHTLL